MISVKHFHNLFIVSLIGKESTHVLTMVVKPFMPSMNVPLIEFQSIASNAALNVSCIRVPNRPQSRVDTNP